MSKIGKRHSESSEEEGEVPDGDSGAGEGNQGNRPSQERNGKKTADALIDELFSDLRRSENPVDVSEAITEDKRVVSEARASRRASERDSGRDADRSRDHKHSKKSKKEKKHKKRSSHRSRSRSRDRKRKRRGSSSDSNAPAKTGTLGEILIKTKNLDDLHKKKAEEKEKKAEHKSSDEDDELPVGADYRTVMSESIAASSSAAASNNGEPAPVLPGSDLPPVKRTAFPLSKSDGEKKEPEDKKSDMLQKVISDKGGASLVPRKLQLDKEPKKDNGTKEETFGPAPPPAAKADAGGDEEEETELMLSKAPPPTKTAAKIAFGQITLKVDPPVEKKEEKAATSTAGPNDSKAGEGGSSSGESSADETAKDDAPAAKLKKEDDAKAKEATVDKKDDKFPERDKDKKSKLSVRKRTESSTDADRKAKKAKEDRDKKKDRKRSRSPERSRDKHSRSRDRRDRSRRSRSRSRDRRGGDRDGRRRRSRSRSGDRRRRSISRERSRLAMRTMRRSRTRSRSRSREKIDKAKLLEVALQNVRGAGGPVGKELSEKMNIKVLEKAGGRNINDIVSYCQKISEEEKAEYERGDGGSDGEGSGRSSLKKKTEIRMNIKDAKQLPTRTPQERLLDAEPLNGVFPVSSGTIHRDSEWKKVDPNASVVPSVCRTVEQKKFVAASSMAKTEAARMGVALPPNPFPILPPPPVPPNLVRGDLIPPPPIPPLFPDYKNFMPPPPMPPVIVTPSADRLLDVGDSSYDEGRRGLRRKMDARGECVERLKKDPNDYDAMKTLRQIDDALKDFADNQELSGRWQGHTRVSNLLSAEELQPHDPRYHAWTRKDLFKHTQPLVSGVGMKLLQKMGWRPGQGLGAQKQGDTLPLALDVKSDRKGLYSEGNDIPISKSKNKGSKGAGRGGGGGGGGGGAGAASLEPKNPISALMELCQRKKWPLPEFIFHEEGGNFSSKKFTCIVKLGGQTFYGPECAQKKAAKTEGAKTALEKIGFAAPNVQTPMIYDPSSQYSMPEQILQARVRQVMGGGREYEMVPPPNPTALAPQPYGVLAPGPKPLVGLPRTMGAVHGAMPGGAPQANNTDSLLMPPPPPPPPAPVKEPPKAVPAPPPPKAPEPVKPPPKAAPVMGGGTGRPPPHHGGPGPMGGAPLAPIGSGWMPDDDGDFTADVAPPRPRPPPSAYSSFPARHEEPRFAPHHAHPMGHHGGSYGRPPRSHSPAYERVRYF